MCSLRRILLATEYGHPGCMCDNDTATTTTSQVMKKRGEGKLKLLEAPDIIKMSPMKIGRGPSLYYVSKRTGWVGLENGQFC